ncbi:hypothetical protein SCUCBS95973_005211 [Sporothrix curviconia]|uniref:Integral membrane protein n=1 Tax=Sporothrix curviconia TaxID=1260050 RepID=A0ABP0BVL9_9PEZI
MAPPQRFGSVETVIGFLWEITFTVLVMRLALVYAALAVLSTALLACVAHAAVLPFLAAQQQVPPQTLLDRVLGAVNSSTKTALLALASLAIIAVVGLCSRIVMALAQIPQLRRFRAAIGGMAATYVSLAWLALNFFSPGHDPLQDSHRSAEKTPTPTNPHMFTPTAGASMSMAAFCQRSRVSFGCAHCNSVSACTVVGLVFVAAVAVMPSLSMALLERPSRWYSHQRAASNTGWTLPATPKMARAKASTTQSVSFRFPLEDKTAIAGSYTFTSEDDEEEDVLRQAPKTRSSAGAKRYALRSPSERRSPRH